MHLGYIIANIFYKLNITTTKKVLLLTNSINQPTLFTTLHLNRLNCHIQMLHRFTELVSNPSDLETTYLLIRVSISTQVI